MKKRRSENEFGKGEKTVERGMAAILAPPDPASGFEVLLDEMAAFLEVIDAFDAVAPPDSLTEDLGFLDVDPLLSDEVLPHLQHRHRGFAGSKSSGGSSSNSTTFFLTIFRSRSLSLDVPGGDRVLYDGFVETREGCKFLETPTNLVQSSTPKNLKQDPLNPAASSIAAQHAPPPPGMASLSVDVASSFFISFATRHARPFYKPSYLRLPFLSRAANPSLEFCSVSVGRSIKSQALGAGFLKSPLSNPRVRGFSTAASSSATAETEDLTTKIPPDNRIPATIITGFLGSGKTTLLNHILTADHGKRIAVIENEYGEVDIDGSLVAAKAVGAEDIVMLNNGCLCCTVRGDLVRMIAELVDKKKGKFDHIVIETTGLANPAPIIQTFYAEDQIFDEVKLDGVVTLVDAKHARIHLDEVKPEGIVNEAIEQVAYADRIIVNKTDLVGESEVVSLIQKIKTINSMAHMKQTKFGKVDLDYVLGIGGFDLERIESAVNVEGSKEDHAKENHDHDHDHDCEKHDCDHHHHHYEHSHEEHGHDHHSHDHTHDPGVSSVSIVCEGTLDLEKANMWLGTLLLERSEDIYRMKGLMSVSGMDERFVFQGVHDIFQGSPDRLWGPDEARLNKIVFIGKNLDSKELEKGFKACLLLQHFAGEDDILQRKILFGDQNLMRFYNGMNEIGFLEKDYRI
ncbi:hypothetical protein V2J09_023414 [Rumex salicifolius]